jgi:hypothetical protein
MNNKMSGYTNALCNHHGGDAGDELVDDNRLIHRHPAKENDMNVYVFNEYQYPDRPWLHRSKRISGSISP